VNGEDFMRVHLGLLTLIVGMGVALGAEPLRSGPQVGEAIPGAFEVHNCNGPDAGEENCLV
jgi:hypothetical protein